MTVSQLAKPADPQWIVFRAATLLSQYFEKSTPENVQRAVALDWAVELADYPEWAIERAVRWWKSSENDDRRKTPLEGDISARAKVEMGVVRAAKMRLDKGMGFGGRKTPENQDKPCSPEAANRIIQNSPFAIKRFGSKDAA